MKLLFLSFRSHFSKWLSLWLLLSRKQKAHVSYAEPASLNRSPWSDEHSSAMNRKIWKRYWLPGKAISSCDGENISRAIPANGPFLNPQDGPGASEWKAIILKCDQLHALCLPLTWLHCSCGGHMSELSRKLTVGNNFPDCFGNRHLDAILSKVTIFVPTYAL